MDVRWVDGFGGMGRSGKHYVAEELEDDEKEAEEAWGPMFNGTRSTNGVVQESFERGGPPLDIGDIVGVGSQSWWKKAPKKKISIMASDKEAVVAPVVRTQEAEIQQVTERMLENANVHAEKI